MLAVVLGGFLFNSLWTPARQVLGYTSDLSATSLLQRTNMARLDDGRTALTMNEKLAEAAQVKANDMAGRKYWSHITPEGKQPWTFVQASGYNYAVVGENLAYGFDGSAATVNAWLNSPEHRANILGDHYREVGFGVATARDYQGKADTSIVVAMYGLEASAAHAATAQAGGGHVLPARTVSRLETISTANAAAIALGVALVAAAGAMYVTLKHGRILRRALVHGEAFIVKHHILDLILLGIGGIGFVITRSAGVIH